MRSPKRFMKVKEIYGLLNTIAPFEYAEDWDNSGLLLGDMESETKKILVTLDVTDEVVDMAIQAGADLIISHHPLIFSPIKQINSENFITRRILKLANEKIGLISMHTNMDATGLDEVAREILQIKKYSCIEENEKYPGMGIGIGTIGKFVNESKEEVNITLREAVIRTKTGFMTNVVKVYGDLDNVIKKPAVCTGSGKSMIENCIKSGCDLLITGDITYHDALDATERGLSIIDAGHYATEVIFIDLVAAFFKMNVPDVEVIPSNQKDVGEFV